MITVTVTVVPTVQGWWTALTSRPFATLGNQAAVWPVASVHLPLSSACWAAAPVGRTGIAPTRERSLWRLHAPGTGCGRLRESLKVSTFQGQQRPCHR